MKIKFLRSCPLNKYIEEYNFNNYDNLNYIANFIMNMECNEIDTHVSTVSEEYLTEFISACYRLKINSYLEKEVSCYSINIPIKKSSLQVCDGFTFFSDKYNLVFGLKKNIDVSMHILYHELCHVIINEMFGEELTNIDAIENAVNILHKLIIHVNQTREEYEIIIKQYLALYPNTKQYIVHQLKNN